MLSRIIHKLKSKYQQFFEPDDPSPIEQEISQLEQEISQNDLVKLLEKIPQWEEKINLYDRYEYNLTSGKWHIKPTGSDPHYNDLNTAGTCSENEKEYTKIHYGCGGNLIENWLNIDLYSSDEKDYCLVNLLEKHPFPNSSVDFGFSEDVLEHLNQAQSIFFISEIYRCLKKDGVIRLSFPGLEGVLKRHYSPASETRIRQGEFEAYSFWDHIHFYSREELRLVGNHIGFRQIEFFEYRESSYPELCGLETRSDQIDLNTYVELTK